MTDVQPQSVLNYTVYFMVQGHSVQMIVAQLKEV